MRFVSGHSPFLSVDTLGCQFDSTDVAIMEGRARFLPSAGALGARIAGLRAIRVTNAEDT